MTDNEIVVGRKYMSPYGAVKVVGQKLWRCQYDRSGATIDLPAADLSPLPEPEYRVGMRLRWNKRHATTLVLLAKDGDLWWCRYESELRHVNLTEHDLRSEFEVLP